MSTWKVLICFDLFPCVIDDAKINRWEGRQKTSKIKSDGKKLDESGGTIPPTRPLEIKIVSRRLLPPLLCLLLPSKIDCPKMHFQATAARASKVIHQGLGCVETFC